MGTIVAQGPKSEADYTDERYWVVDGGVKAATSQDGQVEIFNLVPDVYSGPDGTAPVVHTVTNVTEIAGHTHTLVVGTPVFFIELVDGAIPTANVRRVMTVPTHQLIPVKLTQVGGANGNKTAAATYTYDIFHMTCSKAGGVTAGTQIGSAQFPVWPRPDGKVVPATLGEAFAASDGGVVLWRTNERPTTGGC